MFKKTKPLLLWALTFLLWGCQPAKPPEPVTRIVGFEHNNTLSDSHTSKPLPLTDSLAPTHHSDAPVDPQTGLTNPPNQNNPTAPRQNRPLTIRPIVGNAQGELFEVDTARHQIKKTGQDNITRIFAGSGQPGLKDGQGTAAQFNLPLGLDIDEQGNLYVEDMGNLALRHITPDGNVTTLSRRTPGAPVKSAAPLSAGLSGLRGGASAYSSPTPPHTPTDFGVNPFPGRIFRTVPSVNQHQQWFCEQPFGPQWMGECHDKNQNSLFEPTECTGKPPTSGFDYPQDCPVLPVPTPAPTPVGNCTTYICPNQSEAGKCCDTNRNGTYEADECTDKTPFNGFLTEAQRCT